ncbi:AP-3 complex subunit delta-like [Silene latifolia]|uniref:AP-3 complex subunit delta-like n=1 Tax=Silene latifolia TaxID=37657 RepID=UPI003D781294
MSNSSIMVTLFQRTLDDLIKGIRLHTPETSTPLSTFISKSVEEIRREIKSTDPHTKSTALLKLTYLHTLYGVDMSWAAFHIVEVISFPQFSFKRIGYMAATVSFNEQTDVVLLVTNHFRKDLSSPNDFEVNLCLHCLSIIATTDLSRDLCNDVFVLLSSSRSFVRKKAIAVVLRVFEKYPDGVKVCFKRLVENLDSSDPHSLCAVVGVFCELCSRDPKAYLPLAPEFYRILIDCKNNWVLIKVLKIFAKLALLEPRLANKIVDPICEIMRGTMAKSVLFECIRTVVGSLSDCESAVKLAVLKIREFLSEDDPNLKYLGLQVLSDLAVKHPWAVSENKEAVIKSLSDVDPNIKLASLHLIMAMVSEDNLAEITKVLISYALKSDPVFCNEILRSILVICSQNYYEMVFDFDWYVSLLGDMARIPYCQTGEEIENQLVDIGLRVKDARPELVNVGRDLVIDPALLGNPYLHRILCAAAWVSGEYVEFSKNPFELMEALLQPRTDLLPPSIKAVYIQSALKVLVYCLQSYMWDQDEVGLDSKPVLHENSSFCAPDGDFSCQESVNKLLNLTKSALEPLSWNHDVEIQERSRNVLGILEFLKEGIIAPVQQEDSNGVKDAKSAEITKLVYDMFAEEIGPVSVNSQAKVSLPDDLILKDNLSDLDTIYSDLVLNPPSSFSLGVSDSTEQSKEDMDSSSKSESLLSQHRKRHDLYYLSPEKDESVVNDYPPANDRKDMDNEVDELVKLTEKTLLTRKKSKLVKTRPAVVKLDEGDNFIPTKKKLEATEDLLSGAVREFLLNNDEVSTSSSRSEAAKEYGISKGKEKAASKIKDRSEISEIENPSYRRSKHKTHGDGENDSRKEDRSRKEKKKNSHQRRSKHKAQQEKGNIVVQSSPIPDFLL